MDMCQHFHNKCNFLRYPLLYCVRGQQSCHLSFERDYDYHDPRFVFVQVYGVISSVITLVMRGVLGIRQRERHLSHRIEDHKADSSIDSG